MRVFWSLIFVMALFSCGNKAEVKAEENKELPVLGTQAIGNFGFVAHTGDTITETNMNGKVSVVDFFFTSCPTICPKMKSQMLRVYEAYRENPNVLILSHSIDPEFDTQEVLNDFAKRLEVSGNTWYFLTGEKDSIYAMADKYMIMAEEDPSAPGGYAHSGAFILLDQNRQIRGVYDGTKEQSVDSLLMDIKKILP